MIYLVEQKGNEPNFSLSSKDYQDNWRGRHPSNLELVLAYPANEGLVLQVVHCPPAQYFLRQAGVGHVGLSLIRLGQNGQQAGWITGPQHCPLAKLELN